MVANHQPTKPTTNAQRLHGRKETNMEHKNNATTNANAAAIMADQATTDQGEQTAAFAKLLRTYEQTHAAGLDTTNALYALAAACALSVVKKCIDPQRKTAAEQLSRFVFFHRLAEHFYLTTVGLANTTDSL